LVVRLTFPCASRLLDLAQALEGSRLTCIEPFEGFTLTTFDGETITI